MWRSTPWGAYHALWCSGALAYLLSDQCQRPIAVLCQLHAVKIVRCCQLTGANKHAYLLLLPAYRCTLVQRDHSPSRPKSVIQVRSELSFLDLAVMQIEVPTLHPCRHPRVPTPTPTPPTAKVVLYTRHIACAANERSLPAFLLLPHCDHYGMLHRGTHPCSGQWIVCSSRMRTYLLFMYS